MNVRLLHTTGNGEFVESMWDKLEPSDYEIEVKNIMTGVCRSDIDMMNGGFGPLPMCMSGHEGIGQVTKIGKEIKDVTVGAFVATRGEPAYADYYNVRLGEYVEIPEALPKYILEPVACGINLIEQAREGLIARQDPGKKLLILGSGFLAWVAYHTLLLNGYHYEIDIVGSNNVDLWGDKLLLGTTEKYDVVIDLSSKDDVFTADILNNNALIIFGAQKTITTDFSNLLWKACTMIFPSPRNPNFLSCMHYARHWISTGHLDVDAFWTKGYNRDTEWRNAFEDGNNRPEGYSRGYIVW